MKFQSLEVFIALCLLGISSAYGQATRTIRLPDGSIRIEQVSELEAEIDNEFEPTVKTPRSGKLAVSTKPDSTNALSASEAQSVVSKASSMDYQRNSYAFYRVMEEQRQRGGAGSAADVFAVGVMMGDWDRVGKLLARMPSNSASQVYSRMLAGLAKTSKAQQSLFKRFETVRPVGEPAEPVDPDSEVVNMSYSYRSSSETMNGIFLTDDFFGVVEAAPGALSGDDLRALVALAKVALPGESGQRTMAERLKSGMKNFRESVPAECANAARLLCALGWTQMAEPYLPATAREARDASAEDVLLASEYFAAKGVAENDEKLKQRAWELLASAAAKNADPDVVADKVVTLAPLLDAGFVRKALPALLTNAPVLESPLFGYLARAAAVQPDRSGEERSAAKAARVLRVQALLMEGLVAAGADTKGRTELFNGLIWSWMAAADQSRTTAEQEAQQQARENFYGRQTYRSNTGRSSLTTAEALSSAPAEPVVAKLGTGLARQVRLMKFALMLLEFDEMRARDYLESTCKAHPLDSRDLVSNFLTAWVDKRSSALAKEDPELARMRAQNPYYAQQMQMQGAARPGGVPLTRARQSKNIAEFRQLLADLRKLAPLDPSRVTWAFINIHSGAEVYRDEDIEAIFGPAEKMERAELRMLVAAMRMNLARGWRDMEAQAKAGTNRSEQDVKDEVSRGYGVALNLIKRGLGTEGGEWEDNITRGQLYFDASEFERDRNVKLADYIDLRDAAFASFKQAALKYGAAVQARPRGQWTVAPYQSWFFVLLGASDLSALSARQARNDLGLQGLRESLAALPGDASDTHIRMFAATLTNLLERVPSQMKQKFLAAGVQVVGETSPYAAPAQNVLNYYANLTDEAQLRLTVDGPTRVGHGRPFGAFVTLEHTKQLAREGGGFAKYLQNQAAQMASMYGGYVPPGQRAIDYKSNFETNLYTALGAQFEVLSLTFADPAVKPVDIPRDGWQAMPLAYVVMKAKDPAVDRIPSIQLDVDFADQKGTVVLPILSQVVPVNCADKEPSARPVSNLALAMTLDTREWRGSGKLTFEIAAMGNGIIPPLKELCAVDADGLDAETKDTGLTISTFGGDKGAPQPQASRSWQITYLAKNGAPAPAAFRYPQLSKDFSSAKVEYKRYVDADLETITAAAAHAGIALPSSQLAGMNRWLWTAGIAAFVIANLIFLRRWGRPAKPAAPAVGLPSDFSPFSVVAFLRRIVSDHAAKLNESDRAALLADIRSIEAAHFAAQPAATAPDLRSLAERWQRRAM